MCFNIFLAEPSLGAPTTCPLHPNACPACPTENQIAYCGGENCTQCLCKDLNATFSENDQACIKQGKFLGGLITGLVIGSVFRG